MSLKTISMTDELHAYLVSISLRDHPVLARLRAETASLEKANMQIGPEQGAFMQLLVQLAGARRCLEIGVFTGYSSLAVALALPPDGRITACDVSEEWTAIARRHWEAAGVADRIDLRLAPATATLDALIAAGGAGTFDFAFIDADKENYDAYYERTLELLRPGGLVAIDNVLWGGDVVDATKQDADVVAIRALNRKLVADERVTMCVVPIADGVTLARKRD
ncbi:MAG: class I SAM-dependent methyltransferase [Chloroflexota bacterium]|nr:class I SAM-dependent methyltransferase [Chloroflexota bacterium]